MCKPLLVFALLQSATLLYGQEVLLSHQTEKTVVPATATQFAIEATELSLVGNAGVADADPSSSNPEAFQSFLKKDWNIGFGLALAQPSFTVGHTSNLKGYYAELVNSTISPTVNVGRLFSKGNRSLMNCNLVLSYLRLKEDDRHVDRNSSFDVKMVELLAFSDIYFWNLLRAKSAKTAPKILPFFRFGVGFGVGDYAIVNGNVEPKTVNFALPIGLGFRWELSDKSAILFEYMSRVTFSDSLDGLTSPFGKNDWYGSGGIGLSFKLGQEKEDDGVVGSGGGR